MEMREMLYDIFKKFTTNEKLLRLLYYKPSSGTDNPLDSTKPNILQMEINARWDIINDTIKSTKKVDDLDTTEKCRILFYPGRRNPKGNNYYVSDQTIVIDILTHTSFDEVDMRCVWIADHVNSLLHNETVTGGVKMLFRSGDQIGAPIGYVGYRLIYEYISIQ